MTRLHQCDLNEEVVASDLWSNVTSDTGVGTCMDTWLKNLIISDTVGEQQHSDCHVAYQEQLF